MASSTYKYLSAYNMVMQLRNKINSLMEMSKEFELKKHTA